LQLIAFKSPNLAERYFAGIVLHFAERFDKDKVGIFYKPLHIAPIETILTDHINFTQAK
jgi:hypothetical protein